MIFLGTSGFSYPDWKGYFYPKKISAQDMLAFYAQHFSACEINFTYYRIPTPAHTASLVKKSKSKVHFVVKAYQSMTHQRNATTSEYRAFTEALKPMQDAGVLGAILIQFPYSFPNNLANRGYLADIKENLPPDIDLVVEFRHRSWVRSEIIDFLKSLHLGIVNVDEPDLKNLLPATDFVSSSVGYVRFHGRNREKWFGKDAKPWERYNYLYRQEELAEWVPRIKRIDSESVRTYVFFNNHWCSQAVTNVRQMAELLNVPPFIY